MKTIIRVKQANIRANRKDGRRRPVLIVRTYKGPRYGQGVRLENVTGELVYDPDNPLPCGATLWFEIYEGQVKVRRRIKATCATKSCKRQQPKKRKQHV